ncbi:hypothetical protein [Ferroacidibacillus organovorans]|uniref:DUF2802 domain-containing protein n=1 Tax=Ferroacidibacillus organovorans TaxID=1765683 RepID=A0A101XP77_9BACL|nr:hypothetical protein [Ferroacidibacillus organovorans]KUO95048.1 hypothetical protein ATW55_11255 [Ferroacidibacillus organovorans]
MQILAFQVVLLLVTVVIVIYPLRFQKSKPASRESSSWIKTASIKLQEIEDEYRALLRTTQMLSEEMARLANRYQELSIDQNAIAEMRRRLLELEQMQMIKEPLVKVKNAKERTGIPDFLPPRYKKLARRIMAGEEARTLAGEFQMSIGEIELVKNMLQTPDSDQVKAPF